ncbi:MAG: hypothetical protein R3D78_05175 [Paracoccaceae bacterium]
MTKTKLLALHGLSFLALLAGAAVLATWRGALWPFDPRATALMTLSGLAGVLQGWGVIWLAPLAAASALATPLRRLALWPLGVLVLLGLHAAFGAARGFAPLAVLGLGGAVALYAVPTGLMLVLGSTLREAFAAAMPLDQNQ